MDFFGLLKTPAAQGWVAGAFNDDIAGKGAVGTNFAGIAQLCLILKIGDLKY
jgi:hypothetical protein